LTWQFLKGTDAACFDDRWLNVQEDWNPTINDAWASGVDSVDVPRRFLRAKPLWYKIDFGRRVQINSRSKKARPIRVVMVVPLHEGSQPRDDLRTGFATWIGITVAEPLGNLRCWPIFEYWDNFMWQVVDQEAMDLLTTKVHEGDFTALVPVEHTWLHEKTGSVVTNTYAYDIEKMTSKRVVTWTGDDQVFAAERAFRVVLMVAFR
jgi:hypothetical protein